MKTFNRSKFLFLLIITSVLLACAGGGKLRDPQAAFTYSPKTPDLVGDFPLETMSGKTAAEYLKDENIVAGWNLGNTLESWTNGRAGETLWGNPRINQALMDGVKAAGFDIVRIPVTWMGYIGEAPDHTIAESRLKRIGDVVTMAHNAGLKVIINTHHDGVTEGGLKDSGWLSIMNATYVEDEYKKIGWQFARVWIQIAGYFRNYGDWLMFEPFNELHDGGWGGGTPESLAPQMDTLNKWNQIFTDAVRSTGGNNESRYLVFAGYCTRVEHTLADYFILPNDSSPDRRIVSFHYYDPYEFGIAGRRPTWGTDGDKQKVEIDFAPFKEHFVDRNIPVIVGECGAVLQLYPTNPAMEETAYQSRLEYLAYIYGAAKKYGMVPFYWDNGSIRGNGEKFGLFRRVDGTPNSEASEALIKAMIGAVK